VSARRAGGPPGAQERARRRRWAIALAIAALLAAAAATPAQTPSPPAPPAPTPAPPTPIPATEIVAAAEDVSALLRRIEGLLQADPRIRQIEADLPGVSARLAARRDDTSQMIAEGAQIHALDRVARSWHTVRIQLAQAAEVVNKRLAEIDDLLAELQRRRELWATTRVAAIAANDPPAIVQRIDDTLAALRGAQQQLGRRRAAVLDLQNRVVTELYEADAAVAQIAEAKAARVGSLFERDSRPLWQLDFGSRALAEVGPRVRDVLSFELIEVRDFFATSTPEMFGHVLLFAALAALFRKARRKTAGWVEAEPEPELERKTRVFAVPYSAAFILTVVAMRFLLPQMPHLLAQAFWLATLVPVVRILRRTASPAVHPGIWIVSAFFVVDQVRDVLSAVPQVEQVVLLAEMTTAIALLAWLLRSRTGRAARLVEAIQVPERRVLAAVAIGLLLLAVVAGGTGFMQLARLLASGVFGATYVGGALYVALRAADGLISVALRVRPLRRLRMVERHRAVIEHRAHRTLVVAGAILWSIAVLQYLALDELALASARGALALPIAPKGFAVSLGDVLLAAFVVWLSFATSRVVRFALEEDVFPRLALPRGIPYALATLLHYGILVGGFLLGLAAIGLDLNRFTILAGAFGVGIGFGLQNVVNNFVSGVILLFERPVQVGDLVQIGQLTGEMRRIGIRSSTVRTGQGADVIVPNSTLIADQVTNWTFSDRKRRIEIAVGVAYDVDPERVLKILREIGRAHPAVLAEPAPLALFSGFGESALNFELQVWTTRLETLLVTRSEIGLAVLHGLREAGIEIPFPQRDLHLRTLAGNAAPGEAAGTEGRAGGDGESDGGTRR
jgi:potassium efflux system protein